MLSGRRGGYRGELGLDTIICGERPQCRGRTDTGAELPDNPRAWRRRARRIGGRRYGDCRRPACRRRKIALPLTDDAGHDADALGYDGPFALDTVRTPNGRTCRCGCADAGPRRCDRALCFGSHCRALMRTTALAVWLAILLLTCIHGFVRLEGPTRDHALRWCFGNLGNFIAGMEHGADAPQAHACIGSGATVDDAGRVTCCTSPRTDCAPRTPGAVRYGEADHPGPSALGYRLPGGDGFKGARRADGGADGLRGFVDGEPPRQQFALVAETANATGWLPLQRHLLRTSAHVVMAQEHHLRGEAVAAASSWARRNGWKSLWVEAEPGEGAGTRGGVAVLARDFLGVARPPWGDEMVTPGRAVAATVEAPGHRPIVFVSAYLRDGEGMSAANRAIVASIGACLQKLGHGGESYEARANAMPFVLGADFNCTPEELVGSGILARLGAQLFAPATRRGTCRTARAKRTIDYFVLDEGLARAVADISTVEEGTLATHVPVRLAFHPRVTCLKALGLRHPPTLPTQRLYGPLPPPPCWHGVDALCGDALRAVRTATARQAQLAIDAAYAAWAKKADEELQQTTGRYYDGASLRGEAPRLIWQSVVPEKVAKRDQGTAEPWRYADALARELARTAGAAGGHDADADDGAMVIGEILTCIDARILHSDDSPDLSTTQTDTRRGQPPWQRLRDIARDIETWFDGTRHQRSRDHVRRDGDGERDDMKAMLTQRLEEAREAISEGRTAAEQDDKRHAEERWRAWIAEGADAGARNAHAAVRLPVQWSPTVVEDAQHVYTADPMKLLEAQRREYIGEWQAVETPAARSGWRAMPPLEAMSPAHLRATALQVAERTTQTYDGFHPRHMALLSDPALAALGTLYQAMEAAAMWPTQIGLVTMPALPKPLGGFRLIGIFAAVYRIWSKARRPEAQAWEDAHDRPYFACGADRGAIDVVWRQAMRAEAAVADDLHAAAVTSDMRKFFEAIDHGLLLERAERHGFPMQIAKLAVAAYRGPRMLRLGAFTARELYATRGVIAGCSLATTFTKIYTVDGYDYFVHRCPWATLDNYIDDNVISTEGSDVEVVQRLSDAARVLGEVVTRQFRCSFAPTKTRIVASSGKLGKRVRDAVRGTIGGTVAQAAPNLGADCAAGKARRAHGRRNQRSARLREGMRRRGRIAKVRSVLGDKTISVFATGTLAKMVYASEIHGLSDGELLAVRRAAATAMKPKARGRSLNMLLALHRDPAWRAAVGPFLQYTRMVWRASRQGAARAELTIPEIRRAWEAIDTDHLFTRRGGQQGDQAKRRWSAVRGPLSATVLTLHRIGWRLDDPFTVTDDLGVTRRVLQHSPALWADWLRAAVVRDLERRVASGWARTQPEFAGRRVCLDHLRPQLGYRCSRTSRREGGALEVGTIRAVVCNAVWPNARAHRADPRVSPRCRLCGAPRDTVFHRLWHCPCTEEERRTIAGPQLVRKARDAGEGNRFYSTGVFPHPADVWPSPVHEPDIRITRHDDGPTQGRLLVQGHFYPDGSCTTHVIPELRRASLAVMVKDEIGNHVMTIDTPLWRELPQTPQAAEYSAFAVATQYLGGPSVLHGDCENVLRDANAAPGAQLNARKRFAGVMRHTHSDPAQLRLWTEIRKVKAHVDVASIADPVLRSHADGNARADAAAKQAVSRHPAPPPAEVTMLETSLSEAAKIVRLIAATMPKWPAEARRFARREGGGGGPVPRRQREVHHDWVRMESAWRCRTCLRCHLGAKLIGAVRFEKCDGPRLALQQQQLQQKGHSLCVAQGEGMPIKFCSRCGGWSARRAFSLAKQCPRTPTAAGRQALARIARGRHPWLAVGQREGDRGFIQTAGVTEGCARGEETRRGPGLPGDGENSIPMPPGSSTDGQRPADDDDARLRGRNADAMVVTEEERGRVVPALAETRGAVDTVGTTREYSTSVGVTAAIVGQRMRAAASQGMPRPTREQVHHRLLQSMAQETARRAAKRAAANEAEGQRPTPAQRIGEVRERYLRRKAAQGGQSTSDNSPRGSDAIATSEQTRRLGLMQEPLAAQVVRGGGDAQGTDSPRADLLPLAPVPSTAARDRPGDPPAPEGGGNAKAEGNLGHDQRAECGAAARNEGEQKQHDTTEMHVAKRPRFYDSGPRRRLLLGLAGHGHDGGQGAASPTHTRSATVAPSSEGTPMAEAADDQRLPEQDLRPHDQGLHRPLQPRVHGPPPLVGAQRVHRLGQGGRGRADRPAPRGALGPPRLHAAAIRENQLAVVDTALGSDGCSGQTAHPDRADGSPTRVRSTALGSDGGSLPSVQSDRARGGEGTGADDGNQAPILRGDLAPRRDQGGPARRRSPPPPRDWPDAKRFRGSIGASCERDKLNVGAGLGQGPIAADARSTGSRASSVTGDIATGNEDVVYGSRQQLLARLLAAGRGGEPPARPARASPGGARVAATVVAPAARRASPPRYPSTDPRATRPG